ncbi:endonuclease III [Clostridioides difficile]|nr:endonuclease III [Clostridioides difficile]MBY2486047.1 endonuclease III [Clostridioides difficile]MBY2656731.1 endonuclease III [Clostridioides difficile]MDO0133002.1 endonuclease III [Clostridioides difficile]MDU8655987.1 endonuclease III [Clostridioides difficile]
MNNVNLKEINEKDVIVEEEINKKGMDKKNIIEKEEINKKGIDKKDIIEKKEINKKGMDKKDIIEKEEINKKGMNKKDIIEKEEINEKEIDKMISKKDEIIDEKDIENFRYIEEDKKSTKKGETEKKTKKSSSSKATQKQSKEVKSKSKIKSESANKKDVNKILDELEKLYPDAKCELNYGTAFELLIATILSAQCTDVRVNKVTSELFKKYNTARDFANLSIEEISKEIKSCGLYKSKSQKIKDTSEQLCELYDGEVPDSLEKLIKLPGVGRKTAGVVLSNAFNHPAIAVDTHVFRVSNRIGIVDEPNPQKTEFALMEAIPKERWSHSHHVLIFHGRRMCKARNPECASCPIKEDCNYYKELNETK